ncbi:hypothetical protein CK203_106944 [Vitis vinifera]|uniref:Uncharacterized protein n=1 Tax=Vitis vinifera TaxID=29760 RepID=A0A438FDJ9_VITVI|nr:hypothetical protein CK203_106944 [Vitis vinifera]
MSLPEMNDPLHKKLELIRGKCSALPAPGPTEFCPLDPPQDIEEITEGDFDSGELGNRGMVWMMKELLTISSSAVDVMEELISRREQLRRSLKERIVFDMDNLKSQHKLAMGWTRYVARSWISPPERKKLVGTVKGHCHHMHSQTCHNHGVYTYLKMKKKR